MCVITTRVLLPFHGRSWVSSCNWDKYSLNFCTKWSDFGCQLFIGVCGFWIPQFLPPQLRLLGQKGSTKETSQPRGPAGSSQPAEEGTCHRLTSAKPQMGESVGLFYTHQSCECLAQDEELHLLGASQRHPACGVGWAVGEAHTAAFPGQVLAQSHEAESGLGYQLRRDLRFSDFIHDLW